MYGVIGINFVDHSLVQGALAGHESADTPTGHESGTKGNIVTIGTLIEDGDFNHVAAQNYPCQVNAPLHFPFLRKMNIIREANGYHV